MRRARAAAAITVAGALALAAAPATAQAAREPQAGTGLTVTVHAGGTAFTRFQDVSLEQDGAPQPAYAAALGASTAATLGGDLTVWVRPWLGARLDFGYSPTRFELRLEEDDRAEVLGEGADYRGLDYSDISIYSITVAGVLALPIASTRVATYAVIGAGATLLRADERGAQGLERAFGGGNSAFDVAGAAGLGVKIPLRESAGGRVSLTFELMDRITRTPVRADGGELLLEDGTLRVFNRLHADDIHGGAKYMHAVGISAGMTFATGGATPGDATTPQ